MTPKRFARLVSAALATALVATAPAHAFDTGPHADMTHDALGSEGFGRTAVDVAQVNSWFVDLYENSDETPHSGHAAGWKVAITGLGAIFDSERWSRAVIDAADRTHFDSTGGGFSTARALHEEWERLKRATAAIVRDARDRDDPLLALTALGASLHQVQDFYSHTNWVEPSGAGFDGPGWARRGFGTSPTWFDVPEAVRLATPKLYAGGSHGVERSHGDWKAENNLRMTKYMNKDWSGRPLYTEAYQAAYFATRQWARAVRSWIADDRFWRRMLTYADRKNGALDHDVYGSYKISYEIGHWNGQGEPDPTSESYGPSGSVSGARAAVKQYFDSRNPSRTPFRSLWERVILRLADRTPPAPRVPIAEVPGSAEVQRATRFVRAQITRVKGNGAGDLGPDRADFYVQGEFAGQRFRSAFIHGRDSFAFSRPNHPFEFMKALPLTTTFATPLTELTVRVDTSSKDGAGTDDDVYLRINDQTRFQLDKVRYDDFERGDKETYALRVDGPNGALALSDIRYLQIEKSRDGRNGAWILDGLHVYANGRLIYRNEGIDRLFTDGRLTYRAERFVAPRPPGGAIPLWLELWDDDGLVYGSHDHADIHPHHGRRNVGVAWYPGRAPLVGTSKGGDQHGGRLAVDGDKAELDYKLEEIQRTPPPVEGRNDPPGVPPSRPPASGGQPDLVISELSRFRVTVANVGTAPAGRFMLAVSGRGTLELAGLAPGRSQSFTLTCENGTTIATADAAREVAESREDNNQRSLVDAC